MIKLAFCVDRGALVGLHAALAGIAKHMSAERTFTAHVLHEGLEAGDLSKLQMTIEQNTLAGQAKLVPRAIDTKIFRNLRNHVGHGWMAYMRMLAPSVIGGQRLLYLDADLLVGSDLSELWDFDIGTAAFGAVTWCTRGQSNDASFFEQSGVNLKTPYFNSGVLLIDCVQWLSQNIGERAMEVGRRFERDLPSADQTILNFLMGERFAAIPRRFNTPVSPSRRKFEESQLQNRVIHLVARPKPWDPLGWLNGQSVHFEKVIKSTAISNFERSWPNKKSLRLARAYSKCWRNMFDFIGP